jgi:hypothetical protein
MLKREKNTEKPPGNQNTDSNPQSAIAFLKRLAPFSPDIETILLFVGLTATAVAKQTVLARIRQSFFLPDLISVMVPDLFFFLSLYVLFCLLYMLRPSRSTARLILILAVLTTVWSFLNALWLMRSGAQLQPGILILFARDFKHLWPLVQNYLTDRIGWIIMLTVLPVLTGGFFCWRFVHPPSIPKQKKGYVYRISTSIALILIVVLTDAVFGTVRLSSQGEVLGFSSHFNALTCLKHDLCSNSNPSVETRNIPTAGQRKITLIEEGDTQLPNIVIVLLESVSWDAFSRHAEVMPFLHTLAREGAEFTKTRVPVTHTTKAIWAVMTGNDPVIEPGYVEAIPEGTKYETLATILSRYGYRSAFFQTAKGTFECAPGLCSNLGFDWAWFRENIEDDSAHLGYLSADDCRMIQPALDWITKEKTPFLLVTITSVSHDPYDVPSWFAEQKTDPYEKYIDSLSYTDYFLRQLSQKLTTAGLNENTILCVIGDHGTGFEGDRNQVRWRPLEKVIRVPWLIHWPRNILPGTKIEWPVSQIDVAPTILKLINFNIKNAGFQGFDALSEANPQRKFYFSSWYRNSPMGFVQGNKKIVYWPYQDKIFEFDLKQDPEEKNPIEITHDLSKQLKQQIVEWRQGSMISIDPKKHTQQLLYDYWQTFSIGEKAWAYYIPKAFKQK